jgi:imidazole glycerol-phosphate synthase subunit HisH
MVVIIDYGMGNLHSIVKAFQRLNIDVKVSRDAKDVAQGEKLVLPGVGHFKNGMEQLSSLGLLDVLNERVLKDATTILGICLGAQLMTHHSQEGDVGGLGWVDATTVKFNFDDQLNANLKVPHIGWNQLVPFRPEEKMLAGIGGDAQFYFVHSYYITCKNRDQAVAQTTYGQIFDSIIKKDNIIGVQFHPEKSHTFGLKLLQNFASL